MGSECIFYHALDFRYQCEFIRATNDCQTLTGFVNYLEFTHCNFSENLQPLALVILFLWLIFLFVSLGVTAKNFFCPTLTAISKALKLSDNVAGVTFLAFGNGAPDVISAIVAITNSNDGDAGLAIGALFGAAVFITTVVAGTISALKDFEIAQVSFLRDTIFLVGASYWTFYILYTGEIWTTEAIGFMLLYICYVCAVLIARQFEPVNVDQTPSHDEERSDEHAPLLGQKTRVEDNRCNQLRALLCDINPIDVEGWNSKGYIMRFFEIYKSPIKLLLQITIPLVRHDVDSWNRPLNCFQVLIGPLWCTVLTKSYGTVIVGGFCLWHLMLCLGFILAAIVFFTSHPQEPPVYYIGFAFLGFLTSVFWIFAIATEVVNILKMFGMVFDLSDAILGLTFLAWGNCIGDLVADIEMTKRGSPRMAISACFGGPLFNLLIGIGISCTIAAAKNRGVFYFRTDNLQLVLATGLVISLFTSMFFMIASGFRATKVYTVLLYILYTVFLLVALLTETKIIKW
ncbi:mitochondrial sodium/calcium exchanger protein-like [Asterias amurensis]|uniref:mitochondrial sodium/calcium exchanger protein-like n=1 Tax=Asterias amurensis TaxID=7602 RepID=UPI003AB6E875